MKLSNNIFTNGFTEALSRLLEEKMPMGNAWALTKLRDEVVKNAAVYEEARATLLNQYGKKDKDGNLVQKEEGKGENKRSTVVLKDGDKFNEKFAELLAIEEEYTVEKVALPDTIEISAKDLGVLKDVIKE